MALCPGPAEDHVGPRGKGRGAAAEGWPAAFGDKTGAKASEGQGCQRSPLRDSKRARVAEASLGRGSLGHHWDSKARKGAKEEETIAEWTPVEKPMRCR